MSVFRGLGVNVVYLGDFHDDSDQRDAGPKRLPEQKAYFEAARKLSDKNFLVMPEEEVNSYFDGHWYLMTPKPVYFTHAEPRPRSRRSRRMIRGMGTWFTWGRRTTCSICESRAGHYVDGASADEEFGAVSGGV